MLRNQGIHNDPRKKFYVKIDVQKHKFGDFSYTPEEKIINRFGIFSSVKVAPLDVMLSMKYCTILERAKGRDFYDITELINLTRPNQDYLENRFKFGKIQEDYFGPIHLKEKIVLQIYPKKLHPHRNMICLNSELTQKI